jgi:uncharacterized membrane protein
MHTQPMSEEENVFARRAARHGGWNRPGTDGRRTAAGARKRALGLAWFSLGLGAAEILAPRAVSRLIGARPTRRARATLLAFGLREIAAGLGLLAKAQSPVWMWARVAGDAVDISALGGLLVRPRSDRGRTLISLGSVLGVTLLDVKTALDLGRSRAPHARRGIHDSRAITVNRPRDEVYRFWHDFENLPKFMAHLESVRMLNGYSHWTAKGPGGKTIEWDAEIAIDRPNDTIAWRSREGADVMNQGSVRFLPAPGDRGTEVRVELRYDAPAGALGRAVAKLFGREPGQQIEGDLRRFKQVMETGEVLHSDASIHRGMHPARPPAKVEMRDGKVVAR